nr:MAG TPA: hypothetical protein [Caudoviricetes sp.]
MAKLPSVYKRAGSPLYWGSLMINGTRKQYALCENKAAAQRMLAETKAAANAANNNSGTTVGQKTEVDNKEVYDYIIENLTK